MRVLHVIQDMSMRSGGPPVTVAEASLALNRRGVETTIVTTDAALMASAASRERLSRQDLPPGAEQLDLRICRRQPPRRFAVSLPLQRLLWRIVPSYDLVHIHALYLFPHLAAYRAARRHRVPYVVSPHGALDPYHRRQKRGRKAVAWWLWQKAELENAALLHMLTPEELPLIEDVAPAVPRAVVPVGIRWSEYDRRPSDHGFRDRYVNGYGGPIVMFLGRLTEKKGIDILIEAFAQVAQAGTEARLVIAGGDNEGIGGPLRELVRRMKVEDRTVFTGPLRGEEKYVALAAADVWVLSSRSEGFPTAALEALGAGCACLLSPAVFISREVENAGAGFQCDLNATSFAQAMLNLLKDPEQRHRMGAAARTFAKRYDWDTVSGEWEAMYGRAIARSVATNSAEQRLVNTQS